MVKDHRHTEIKSFDTIVAAKEVDANEKLYIDSKADLVGTDLKKEFVQNCSDLDDVIIFIAMVRQGNSYCRVFVVSAISSGIQEEW